MEFPCPNCGRLLQQDGELTVDGNSFPCFTCEDCKVETRLLGAPMLIPYLFAVDATGRAFNPADDVEGTGPVQS